MTGLRDGRNVLAAGRARLTVVNHPITGPVFSGPHEQPFVCETEAAGLGAPLDADCSVATRTRDVDGVRLETGTINRGIYEIAMPAQLEPAADLQLRRRLHRRLVPPGPRRPPACSTTSCSATATPSRPRR